MPTETILSDVEVLRRVDLDLILDELLVFLRNNLTDRRTRTTNSTDTFTGDGTTSLFTFTVGLDSNSRSKIMNVKTVTIAGVSKTYFTDYITGYDKESTIIGKIQFWNAPSNSASIVVNVDHTKSWIYPERPRIDLTSRSYPRMAVQIKSKPEPAAVGGKATKYVITVVFTIIDLKRNQVEKTVNEVQRLFSEKSTQKGFKNFQWIVIENISDVIPSSEDSNDTVYGCQIDCQIPFEYQFSK